jgi:8-oxo-dGTP diphosphatase
MPRSHHSRAALTTVGPEHTGGVTEQIVVAAAIVRAGLVLAARRSGPPELAGRWEFPGGKVEAGESDAVALVRECVEELAVTVRVGALLGVAAISDRLELRLYRAGLVSGTPVAGADHDELRWVGAGSLDALDWLPADRPLLPAVRELL